MFIAHTHAHILVHILHASVQTIDQIVVLNTEIFPSPGHLFAARVSKSYTN